MDLRIFDKQLNALGVIDEAASVIWTVRYFDVGEFKILAPITDNNRELLVRDRVVVKHDKYTDYTDADGAIWRRGAVIKYVHYTKDETGQEHIEATGYGLSKWLSQRVIAPTFSTTGTKQAIVNELVTRNIGSKADTARQFPQFITITQSDFGGVSIDYSPEYLKDLGDEVKAQCQDGKLGYDILVNERTKQFGFYLYEGRNLTDGNTDGNPPCIFSRDFDNVTEQEYENSVENYKNFAYVRGSSDSNNVQMIATFDGAGASGLDRCEVLVDATDMSRSVEGDSGTSTDIPDATYKTMLENRGATELATMIEAYTFKSTIRADSNLAYKDDFDLGDRVTCIEKRWGIKINSRITEVSQTWEKGKTTLEATFGESTPTLLEAIKKRR